jgi:Phosphopantetheine attachment site
MKWQRQSVRLQAGLDSLGAAELRTALSSRFSIRLPATAAFDHPTAAALATIIAPLLQPAQTTAAAMAAGQEVQRQLAVDAESSRAGTGAVTEVVAASTRFPGAAPGNTKCTALFGAFRFQHSTAVCAYIVVTTQCWTLLAMDLKLLYSECLHLAPQAWTGSGVRWLEAPAWRALCRCSAGMLTPYTAQRYAKQAAGAAFHTRQPRQSLLVVMPPCCCSSAAISTLQLPVSGLLSRMSGVAAVALAASQMCRLSSHERTLQLVVAHNLRSATLHSRVLQTPAPGRSYARFAAFLDAGGVAAFDAGALRFSRPEAVALDPHARLLLESTQV